MRWQPSPEQIGLIADLETAHAPLDRAAALLGIKPRTLKTFLKRLEAARAPRAQNAISSGTASRHNQAGCLMIHKIDLTGDYETTIYDVARRLLAAGADTGDRVETRRHGIFSMSGIVGELAELQVVFAASGPRLVRHRGCISGPLTAKTPEHVQLGISAPGGGSHA